MVRIDEVLGDPLYEYRAGGGACTLCRVMFDGMKGRKEELEDYRDLVCLEDCEVEIEPVRGNDGSG